MTRGPIPTWPPQNTPSTYEEIRIMLGADEVVPMATISDGLVLRVRIGERWAKVEIPFQTIARMDKLTIRDLVLLIAEQLRGQFVETATVEHIDRLAMNMGVDRGTVEPERKMTRFEAIAEELKSK